MAQAAVIKKTKDGSVTACRKLAIIPRDTLVPKWWEDNEQKPVFSSSISVE